MARPARKRSGAPSRIALVVPLPAPRKEGGWTSIGYLQGYGLRVILNANHVCRMTVGMAISH